MPNGYTRPGPDSTNHSAEQHSVEVAGLIAPAGLETEIGSVMLLYLDKSARVQPAGRMNTDQDLRL